jgi:hypothetical protein
MNFTTRSLRSLEGTEEKSFEVLGFFLCVLCAL